MAAPLRGGRWAGAALLAALFLLLLAKGGKVLPAALLLQALVLAGAGILFLLGPVPFPSLLPPLALLGAFQSLSAASCPCPEGAWLALGRFWAPMAFGALTAVYWRDVHRRVFVGGLLALVSFQALLWALPGGILPKDFLFPGNPQYGAFLAMLAAFICLHREEGTPPVRWGIFLFLAAGVLFSANRSAAAGWSAGLLVLLSHRFGTRGALFGVAGILAFLFIPAAQEWVMKSWDPLAWKRLDIWAAAAEGVLARPWLGWGPGQFESLYRLYAVPQSGPVRFDHSTLFAHNDFLQLAAASGLPALAAFLWFLWRLWCLTPRRERALLAAGGIMPLFNFPFALPVAGLAAGAAAVLAAPVVSARPGRVSRFLGVLFLTLASVALFRLPSSFRSGPPERIFYGRSADDLARAQELMDDPATRAQAAALVDRSLRWNSSRGEAWRLRAALEGDPEAAARDLRRALALHPFNAVWHLELGLWLERAGDNAGALAAHREALRLEPSYGEAAFHIGRMLAAAGRRKEAAAVWRDLRDRPAEAAGPGASAYARRILARDDGALSAALKDIIPSK